jgi:hypothetical protein
MVTAVCWVHTCPLPLYFLLITSQRRNDIWQNRNINDRRVTGHKHVSSRCPTRVLLGYAKSSMCASKFAVNGNFLRRLPSQPDPIHQMWTMALADPLEQLFRKQSSASAESVSMRSERLKDELILTDAKSSHPNLS